MHDADDLLLNPKAIAQNRRRFFFKYMSYETACIVLQNQTLRWSTPIILNDPFDMNFRLHIDVDFERVKQMALDQSWNDHFGDNPARPGNNLGELISLARRKFAQKGISMSREDFGKYFESAIDESLAKVLPGVETAYAEMRPMLDRTKVLCLATQPDNVLMWSHYALQHTGVVIRLENIPEMNSPYSMAQEVSYPSAMPRRMDEQGLANLLSGRGRSDLEELFGKVVLTKSHHWSYEAEWRIYGGFGRDPAASFEDLQFGAPELESLIFGCRMDDDKRNELKVAANLINPDVRLWSANPSKYDFRMEIEEIA